MGQEEAQNLVNESCVGVNSGSVRGSSLEYKWVAANPRNKSMLPNVCVCLCGNIIKGIGAWKSTERDSHKQPKYHSYFMHDDDDDDVGIRMGSPMFYGRVWP